MAFEHIDYNDPLRKGTDKLNDAIDGAKTAYDTANNAKTTADTSIQQSTNTQTQLDTIVIEGDSSVEAAQARVTADGTTYTTLKERLDTQHGEIIADKVSKDRIPFVNVMDYGAVADGVTDDTTAIQAAVDDAVSRKASVFFPAGTYKITGSNVITASQGPVVWFGVPGESILDFSDRSTFFDNGYNNSLIRIQGSLGTQVNISADFKTGEKIINADPSGLSEGDLLLITSNDDSQWPGDTEAPYIGQLSEVANIIDASSFKVADKAYSDYLLLDNAYFQKVNAVEFVDISGLTFIGQGKPAGGTGATGDSGLMCIYSRDVYVHDCKFVDIDGTTTEFAGCYNFKVDNLAIDKQDRSEETGLPIQYGIKVSCGSHRGLVTKNSTINGRTGIIQGHYKPWRGINRFITVKDNVVHNMYSSGISQHNSDEFIKWENNLVTDCIYGFSIKERRLDMIGNVAINCDQGLYLKQIPRNITVINNRFENVSNGILMLDAGLYGTPFTSDIVIRGNFIKNASENGIRLQNTINTNIKRVVIDNNFIDDINSTVNYAGIYVVGKFTGTIRNNLVIDSDSDGVKVDKTYRILMSDNHVTDIIGTGLVVHTAEAVDTIVRNNVTQAGTALRDSGTTSQVTDNVQF